MSEFFHMGGYAAYVWSAYGLSVAVLVLNVIAARKRNLNVKREIKKLGTAVQ
ncbi:MAG: heme exporter protein CcmD [Arenicellales bacterium]|nr:heme exporter protein CcmD [Arenicellales bacterium]